MWNGPGYVSKGCSHHRYTPRRRRRRKTKLDVRSSCCLLKTFREGMEAHPVETYVSEHFWQKPSETYVSTVRTFTPSELSLPAKFHCRNIRFRRFLPKMF